MNLLSWLPFSKTYGAEIETFSLDFKAALLVRNSFNVAHAMKFVQVLT